MSSKFEIQRESLGLIWVENDPKPPSLLEVKEVELKRNAEGNQTPDPVEVELARLDKPELSTDAKKDFLVQATQKLVEKDCFVTEEFSPENLSDLVGRLMKRTKGGFDKARVAIREVNHAANTVLADEEGVFGRVWLEYALQLRSGKNEIPGFSKRAYGTGVKIFGAMSLGCALRSCTQPVVDTPPAIVEEISNNGFAENVVKDGKIFDSSPVTETKEVTLPEWKRGEADLSSLGQLEEKGVDVQKVWFVGQTYDDGAGLVLTEENTTHFDSQRKAILNTLNEALSFEDNELPQEGSLWLTLGSNTDREAVLLGQYYDAEGVITALVCPGFERESYQIVTSVDPGNGKIVMHFQQEVISARGGSNKFVRLEQGWIGTRDAIGGPADPETLVRLEKPSTTQPIYTPINSPEPAKKIAQKFGIAVEELKQANPGMGDVVEIFEIIILPFQPKKVEQSGLLRIQDFGVDFELPATEEVLEFLTSRGWEPSPLTINFVKKYPVSVDPPDHVGKPSPEVEMPTDGGIWFRQGSILILVDSENIWAHELCHELFGSSEETAIKCADGGLIPLSD